MKIILTGATGFIGAEALQHCLANPAITSVVAVARRPLPPNTPNVNSPKLKVVIHEDFLSWPASVLEELKGAESCIWALGKATTPSLAQNRIINLDYTIAAARAFATSLAPQLKGSAFRFVYVSGFLTEKAPERSLWVLGDMRRLRGDVEKQVLAIGKEHDSFDAFIARPAFVLNKGSYFNMLASTGLTVRLDELAAALMDTAVRGSEGSFIENDALKMKGSALLKLA